MEKNNIRSSLFLKILAVILICAAAIICISCIGGLLYCYEDGWYAHEGGIPFFWETRLCRDNIYHNEFHFSEIIYDRIGSDPEAFHLYLSSSYSASIYGSDGKELFNNVPDGAKPAVSGLSLTVFANELSYKWESESTWDSQTGERIYYDYDEACYKAFPDDFTPGYKQITINIFLNWPIKEYTEPYFAFLLYKVITSVFEFFIPICIVCMIAALLLLWFLLWSAGWHRGDTAPTLHAPNNWPLALYTALILILLIPGAAVASTAWRSVWVAVGVGLLILGIVIAAVLFLMTLAARIRCRALWKTTAISWICRTARAFFRALPSVWKYVAVYVLFLIVNAFFGFLIVDDGNFLAFLLLMIIDGGVLALIITYALQLSTLRQGAKALASGNLGYKVDTLKLWPGFRRHGEDLNSISAGMSRAVDARMQSERFKTDLITNVSHDLKTPLTNIVSYVDLLRRAKPGSEEQAKYMDVLDRQSAKLKKLTEDLIQASKAASGAVNVNREILDAAELLKQCAGEWTERLEKCGIQTVVNVPASAVNVIADGHLVSRVFDNLLSNVSKYSMPGTRAYIDLASTASGASVVFRNISREMLGIPANQLMERFVRGDASRHSEGSGLGLSIAQSLTALMGGRLELSCEGDMFRAQVLLPLAPAAPAVSPEMAAARQSGIPFTAPLTQNAQNPGATV